jgi:hypothetical protein
LCAITPKALIGVLVEPNSFAGFQKTVTLEVFDKLGALLSLTDA